MSHAPEAIERADAGRLVEKSDTAHEPMHQEHSPTSPAASVDMSRAAITCAPSAAVMAGTSLHK